MNIYAIRIPKELSNQQMKKHMAQIPLERQERVIQYVRKEDAIRSLCGSLLSQYVILKELNLKNFTYSYNKYGKPSIKGFPNFYYNISHSYDWVVCATDNSEIGIDIEKIKAIDLDIARRFFAPMEYARINRSPTHLKQSYFYEYWTMKESYIKAVGKGLTIPLNSFCIVEAEGGYMTIDQNSNVYFFTQIDLDKDYRLAVCSTKKVCTNEIKQVALTDFNSVFSSDYRDTAEF